MMLKLSILILYFTVVAILKDILEMAIDIKDCLLKHVQ